MSLKEDLLEGAIRCIQSRGYARTTARDLVAASGANLGAIGYHYGSKEQLLNAAVVEGFRRWLDPLIASCSAAGGGTPWQRLEDGLATFLASLDENRELVVGYFEAMAQAERSDELRGQLAAAYEELRGALAAAVRATLGANDAVDEEAVASLMLAVSGGLMTQWLLDPDGLPPVEDLLRSAGSALAIVAAGGS